MRPDIVVDVGNTRLKWGRCEGGRVVSMASLPRDDEGAWLKQWAAWKVGPQVEWALAGVDPSARNRFGDWLRTRGQQAKVIERWQDLPLCVALEEPERAGIDRLLNAVAARSRAPAATPAIIVDAGSAVTVDMIDESGAFRGGAIFPGLRLMSQSLHDYTALLPLVTTGNSPPQLPATSTEEAVRAGVFWSAVGGVRALIDQLSQRVTKSPVLFLAGGDAPLLSSALPGHALLWPEMTLDGLRLTAESLS